MYGVYENGQVIGVFTAPLTVKSNQPVFVSDSLSLKRSRQKRTGQRWEITTGIRPENQDANDLFALFVEKGYTNPIDILMPQNTGSRHKRVRGTPPVATGSLDGDTIVVSTTSKIPRGTYIRFGNHSKIYLTLSEKSAAGVVKIYPTLQQAVVNQSMKWEDDVIMPAYIDLDTTVGMSYSDGILMDLGTVKFVEAL
jgi:hypothetical protein